MKIQDVKGELFGTGIAVKSRMKKPIILLTTLLLVSQSIWAQSCPLTNAKLTDLRVAAMKLSQKLTLSPRCQKFEEQVNSASTKLSDLSTKISDMSEGEYSIDEKHTTALAAVTQLNAVTAVFNDKTCGKELVGFMDYVGAFADVANGLSPFLALYGGPAAMPWAIGTALAGTTVKSIVTFFQSKDIDMRNPEQSAAFIQNSCSFYDLDLVKTSIEDLQMNRFSKIEGELEKNKKRLENFEANKPAEPSSEYKVRLSEATTDGDRIKYLASSFASDPVEACVYIQSYANGQDGGMVNRVWRNYEESIAKDKFRVDLEKNYFLNILNRDVSNLEFTKCKELGGRWLTKMDSMSKAGISFLETKSSKEDDVLKFNQWKKETEDLKVAITTLEAKLKYLQEMFGTGFDIEYSEIIRSYDQVKDAIFLSYKNLLVFKFKGLAEAWLRVKQEDAHLNHKDFFVKKESVEKRIENVLKIVNSNNLDPKYINAWAEAYRQKYGKDHPEVNKGTVTELCNQLRLSWISWNDGYTHAKAGKNYCTTFDKVINQLEYPAIQSVCFGTNNRTFDSLRNQVKTFEGIKGEADDVVKKMSALSCSRAEIDLQTAKLTLQ